MHTLSKKPDKNSYYLKNSQEILKRTYSFITSATIKLFYKILSTSILYIKVYFDASYIQNIYFYGIYCLM